MLKVVTVIRYGIDYLPHFINHYKFADEINIVVYESTLYPNLLNQVKRQIEFHKNVKIVEVIHGQFFDLGKVTELYNAIKSNHPNDWWIVTDIDEFQIYQNGDVKHLIELCDVNGWELVRGGTIDRVGINGSFPTLTHNKSIFEQFPMMGFFSYPVSKISPNKISIMKGHIELTPGQHYAKIDGHTTWKWEGWGHPLIAPPTRFSVQVHHFKWDNNGLNILKQLAESNEEYMLSNEYRKILSSIQKSNYKIDIKNKDYMFEMSDVTDCSFNTYSQWYKLIRKIISI